MPLIPIRSTDPETLPRLLDMLRETIGHLAAEGVHTDAAGMVPVADVVARATVVFSTQGIEVVDLAPEHVLIAIGMSEAQAREVVATSVSSGGTLCVGSPMFRFLRRSSPAPASALN